MTRKEKGTRKEDTQGPEKEREETSVVEQAEQAEQDERAVNVPKQGFPIVGIGASAGGLAAFEAFFSAMPADTDPGMAFVLVQQLSRAEVLEPYRAQRVAKDGRIVEVWLTATALVSEAGEVYAIAITERMKA